MPATARAVGQTFLRQGGAGLLQLVNIVLIARFAGPTGTGQFSVGVFLTMFLSLVTSFGAAPAIVYFVARRELRPVLARNVALIVASGSSALGFVLLGLITVFKEQVLPTVETTAILMAAVAFPIVLLNSYLLAILQGLQDFVAYNKVMILPPLATVIATVALVQLVGLTGTHALVAWTFGHFIGLVLSLTYVRTYGAQEWSHCTPWDLREALQRVLAFGWRAHLANAMSYLIYRMDIFLLNLFSGTTAVGLYTVAVQVAERMWILSSAVMTVVSPRISTAWKDGNQSLQRALAVVSAQTVGVLSAVGSVLLVVLAGPILVILFGSSYVESKLSLQILAVGTTLLSIGRVFASSISAIGRPDVTMMVAAAALFCNVIGNLWLIPRFGHEGAAIATSSSYGVAILLNTLVFMKYYGASWKELVTIRQFREYLLSEKYRLGR